MIAASLQVIRQMDIDQAWLDDRVSIPVIHLQDPFHSRQGDHHSAADRKAAPCQTGSRTARNEGNIKFVAEFNDCNDLFSRRWKDHHIRRLLIDDESIAFVNKQFVRIKE